MRGAHPKSVQLPVEWRIIPADAGSTSSISPVSLFTRDHPRGCGEHNVGDGSHARFRGSSPRMRGARDSRVHPATVLRIIPADAGSTFASHVWYWAFHRASSCIVVVMGIIPADAGSTRVHEQYRRGQQDHPRGCGEHSITSITPLVCQGSSPRMRGAQLVEVAPAQPGGIIPADAGSTRPCSSPPYAHRDHPRGCGEHPRSRSCS